MQIKEDLYEILDVNKKASQKEIKSAYRKLAKQHHPDKGGDEEFFKKISYAYDILSTPEKKSKYDQFGHSGLKGHQGPSMEDIFGDLFGKGRRQKVNLRRGKNLRINIPITIDNIVKGVKKTININRDIKCESCNGIGSKDGTSHDTCNHCNGTGTLIQVQRTPLGMARTESNCPHCNASGKIIKEKCEGCHGIGVLKNQKDTVEINIPRGARQGMQFAIGAKGNDGMFGGESGDLLIDVTEIPHEDFMLEHYNVMYDLHISVVDAIMGKKGVEIETPKGKVKLDIPKGCQDGKALRLAEMGLPVYESHKSGDMIVYVNVDIPEEIDEETKETLRGIEKELKVKNKKKGSYRSFREHFIR